MDAMILKALTVVAGHRLAEEPKILANDGHTWSGRVRYHHPEHGILTLFVHGYFVGGRNLKRPVVQEVTEVT